MSEQAETPGSLAPLQGTEEGKLFILPFCWFLFLPLRFHSFLPVGKAKGVPVSPSSDHCLHFWGANPSLFSVPTTAGPQLHCLLVTLGSIAKLLRHPGGEREV